MANFFPECVVGNEADFNVGQLAQAFGIVAGLSVAVALLALGLAGEWRRFPRPVNRHAGGGLAVWPGAAIIGLFAVYGLLVDVVVTSLDQAGVYQKLCGPTFPRLPTVRTDAIAAAGGGLIEHAETTARSGQHQLRVIWSGFLTVPLMLGLVLLLRRPLLDRPLNAGEFATALPNRVVSGVAAGIVIVPVCFAIHALALWVAFHLDAGFDQHPLTLLRPSGDGYGGLVFGLSVILVVPILEELLFRGLVLGWAEAEWHRPWVVMVFAAAFALKNSRFQPVFGPMVFLALLGVGLYLMQRFAFRLSPHFPTRTAAAVWSSSTLFAVAHSSVWPSPIPLFAFALGLGYLTARTRDITAAVVLHGMFNAVSFVYLLRGGG